MATTNKSKPTSTKKLDKSDKMKILMISMMSTYFGNDTKLPINDDDRNRIAENITNDSLIEIDETVDDSTTIILMEEITKTTNITPQTLNSNKNKNHRHQKLNIRTLTPTTRSKRLSAKATTAGQK
jgi:hypothetical protein